MTTLRDLIPLLSTPEQKHKEQDKEDAEAWALFLELEEQYSRTNHMLAKEEHEETSEQGEADMARNCFLARGKHSE